MLVNFILDNCRFIVIIWVILVLLFFFVFFVLINKFNRLGCLFIGVFFDFIFVVVFKIFCGIFFVSIFFLWSI